MAAWALRQLWAPEEFACVARAHAMHETDAVVAAEWEA
jgi:hypothetical protein